MSSQQRNSRKYERMVLISVHLPKWMLEELDKLVREGKFPNRSEAIRVAIRDLLMREKMSEKEKERERKKDVLDIVRDVIVPGR